MYCSFYWSISNVMDIVEIIFEINIRCAILNIFILVHAIVLNNAWIFAFIFVKTPINFNSFLTLNLKDKNDLYVRLYRIELF